MAFLVKMSIEHVCLTIEKVQPQNDLLSVLALWNLSTESDCRGQNFLPISKTSQREDQLRAHK